MTAQGQDILDARDALRRIQTGRVWFEPHSDCLDPIIEAINALDRLAGYDNVRERCTCDLERPYWHSFHRGGCPLAR